MTAPIRVLLADDSAFMRLALRRIVEGEADLRVVGEAADGGGAVEAAARLRPDVVVMDLAMPAMDGIEATRRIMALPSPPAVVMVSALTREGSEPALRALAQGAVDYLWKNSDLGGADLARLDRELRPLLRRWAAQRRDTDAPPPVPPSIAAPPGGPPEVLLVGASTGGPEALLAFLVGCGAVPLPCVVAQHMPVGLAPELAGWLSRKLDRAVMAATDGQTVVANSITVLPGGSDGALVRRGTALALRLATTGALAHPSVDVLFRSAAAVARGAVGVVLTGMGRDGAAGAAAMAARGMPVLAQSPDSCVVAGMPRAVIAAGLAQAVDAPPALGGRVAALLSFMAGSAP
jgi:two-component system chemotaxis response regulator CheB